MTTIHLAAKCAPDKNILRAIQDAGITAVELYLSKESGRDPGAVLRVCEKFKFTYAVHAPTNDFYPAGLAEIVRGLNARITVFHDIYWEEEWEQLAELFKSLTAKPCVENLGSIADPVKYMRRLGFGRCLDLEHIQFEIGGVFETEFVNVMREASHIHMTGFYAGSTLWHTHLHHAPEHSRRLLDMLAGSGYAGMVVSEAMPSLQTREQFTDLKKFYDTWAGTR